MYKYNIKLTSKSIILPTKVCVVRLREGEYNPTNKGLCSKISKGEYSSKSTRS